MIRKIEGRNKTEKSRSNKFLPLPIAKSPARKNSKKQAANSNFESRHKLKSTPTIQRENKKR